MSKDNIVLIKKTDDGYEGYDVSINDERKLDDVDYSFCVNSIEEVIIEARKINAEYGYSFVCNNELNNWEENSISNLFVPPTPLVLSPILFTMGAQSLISLTTCHSR